MVGGVELRCVGMSQEKVLCQDRNGVSAASSNSDFGTEEVVKIESDDYSKELIGEEEIPF